MKATITTKGYEQQISGKNLSDIRKHMNQTLDFNGPQALTAKTDTGTTIHVEVWEGQDYIYDKRGRKINDR